MDFKAFDRSKLNEYSRQAKELYGNTPEYKEMEEKREQIGQYQKEHEDLTVQARESLKRQEEAEKAVQDADEKRMLLDQQVEEQKQTIIQTLNEKADLTAKKQRYETMLEQVLVRRSEVAQKLLKSKSDESVQEEQRKEEEKLKKEVKEKIKQDHEEFDQQ